LILCIVDQLIDTETSIQKGKFVPTAGERNRLSRPRFYVSLWHLWLYLYIPALYLLSPRFYLLIIDFFIVHLIHITLSVCFSYLFYSQSAWPHQSECYSCVSRSPTPNMKQSLTYALRDLLFCDFCRLTHLPPKHLLLPYLKYNTGIKKNYSSIKPLLRLLK